MYRYKVGFYNDKYLLEPKVRIPQPRVKIELKLNTSDLQVELLRFVPRLSKHTLIDFHNSQKNNTLTKFTLKLDYDI